MVCVYKCRYCWWLINAGFWLEGLHPPLPPPSFPCPSFPFLFSFIPLPPLPSLSTFPSLRNRATLMQGVLGSTVSSPSRVGVRAPAKINFGAFSPSCGNSFLHFPETVGGRAFPVAAACVWNELPRCHVCTASASFLQPSEDSSFCYFLSWLSVVVVPYEMTCMCHYQTLRLCTVTYLFTIILGYMLYIPI